MSSDDIIEDIISTTKQPSQEELDDFKNKITEWCKMDDQIAKLIIAIKERKVLQKALNSYIKDFMFKFNFHDVNINNCRITAKQKEYLTPLSTNDIKKNILENKNICGDELIKVIFNPQNRKKKKKEIIKKILPKIQNITL